MTTRLQETVARWSGLRHDAIRTLQTPIPFKRVEPHFPTLVASFISPDMAGKEPAWINTRADYYVCRVRYSVWAQSTNVCARAFDQGAGIATNVGGFPLFDFMWNIKRMGSDNWYGAAARPTGGNGGNMLSRLSLGYGEFNKPLTFERGWCIKRGDGVVVRIQPIRFSASLGSALTFTRFSVHVTLDGFWGHG